MVKTKQHKSNGEHADSDQSPAGEMIRVVRPALMAAIKLAGFTNLH